MTCAFRLRAALAAAFLLLLTLPVAAEAARVRLETSEGVILIEVDTKRAPITAANFLRYVDEKLFDGKTFYRAARNRTAPTQGLIQGGINKYVVGAPAPIAHEPTSRTGLRHGNGTLSMARNAPGTAMGDFFITLGPSSYLDARDGNPGYAAFGRVVSGMPVVQKILAKPTYPGGRSQNTMGQSIMKPVKIISARRVK
ncbi:peptidylprolyl isomerase [Allosphingosinicella indica]|uniref:peptidylprolyl isomerase n=1 Tax=Allosphingosinicella indica TaxID=941907 RepID=A0A1X7GUZ1_9SPHN|nr:peptidylprolyl isomerase [Allosphingosinicella indica]SMF75147.1 peptidyl-prolyl cis-trans isomerase A (cyclophilin A) [Allosphingosinicella indica]